MRKQPARLAWAVLRLCARLALRLVLLTNYWPW